MKVTSSAAVGSLTVSESEKSKDLTLQWILSMASSKQLSVTVDKKSKLSLTLRDGTLTLIQRPAILRALAGAALHNALDRAPHFALGGHADAGGSSPFHAVALASITSWMSAAGAAASASSADPDLIATLESHLATRSYLVPSSQCTLADVDMSMALLKSAEYKQLISSGSYPNVHRWASACCATLMEAGTIAGVPMLDPLPQAPPMFFYGDEDPATVPTTKPAPKPAAVAAGAKKDGAPQKQQQQQQQQQQQGKKKQPKQQQQQQGKKTQQQAPATFGVSALDIRVGKIVKAWHHPDSDKLFCEEVDLGEESGPRKIASGLRAFYKTEDLEGRLVVVLCNLKARSLAGFPSHGMVLCASNADHTQVQFMAPPEGAAIGERVVFDGCPEGAPEPENKVAKKKIFEGLAPDLKTNADGVCEWKGHVSKLEKAGGPIRACDGMPNAQVS